MTNNIDGPDAVSYQLSQVGNDKKGKSPVCLASQPVIESYTEERSEC